jgi:hypothetical protein
VWAQVLAAILAMLSGKGWTWFKSCTIQPAFCTALEQSWRGRVEHDNAMEHGDSSLLGAQSASSLDVSHVFQKARDVSVFAVLWAIASMLQ